MDSLMDGRETTPFVGGDEGYLTEMKKSGDGDSCNTRGDHTQCVPKDFPPAIFLNPLPHMGDVVNRIDDIAVAGNVDILAAHGLQLQQNRSLLV